MPKEANASTGAAPGRIRVLVVEDSRSDAELEIRELVRAGLAVEHRIADRSEALRRELVAFRPDIILSDFSMPDFDGTHSLAIAREMAPHVPFIFVSGTMGEEHAIRAIKEGATDYVLKTNLIRLPSAVERALQQAREEAAKREIARALAESEAGLRRAQLMAQLGHVITGHDGSFESWSDTLPKLIGVPPAQMPASTRAWLELIHPEDRARFRAEAIKGGRTEKRIEFEYRLKHADGSWMHIKQVSEPMSAATDAPGRLRWFGTLQNVSDQKLAAQSLRESEGLKGAILESSLDCIVTIDCDGRVVEFNPAAETTFGLRREQALGQPIAELIIPPRLREAHHRGIARYLATGEGPILGKRVELEAMRADGTEFPAELAIVAIRSGPRPLFTGFIRDLTERKRIEEDLRRFRLALDNSADIILIVDRATMRHVDANKAACELLGYTREELLRLGPQDLLPVDRPELEKTYDALIADPSQRSGMQSYYRCKDGGQLPFESTRHVFRSGDSWLITVVSRDIRQRLASEEEQRSMRQLLDNIVENIPTAVQLKSVADDYRVMMWNKAAERVYGVPQDEAIGKNVHDLWPKPDADRFHAADLELIADGGMQDFPERPARTRDRGDIRVHMRKVALFDAAGKATHLLVIADDITAQLAGQERLRENEARFRSLSQLSSDWFWQQDEEFRFVEFTGGDTPQGWGPDQKSALGLRRWELPGVAPVSGNWDEHKAQHEAHLPYRDFEYQHVRVDGTTKYISASGEPVFDAEGRFTGYRGVATEITQRKRAEWELQRFGKAMDISPDSIYLTDPATMRFVYLNRTACLRLGLSREELLQKGPQDVLPVPGEQIRREYGDVIAAGEAGLIHERPFVRSDGSSGWTELHRRALATDGGTLIVTIGRDITERKVAEEGLRESEARFRSLTQLSSDWYWEQDEEYRFVDFSGGGADSAPDQAIARRLHRWDLTGAMPATGTWEEHKALLEARLPFRNFEYGHNRPDGTRNYVSASGEPVFDAGGRFKGYRGVASDITVRKRAERVLSLEHGVARHLADASTATGGLQAAMQLICESEGWDFGRYWRVDEAAGLLRFAEAWSSPGADGAGMTQASIEVVFAPGAGLAGSVWQSGQPLWVAHVGEDARVQRKDLARAAGMRGAFVVPVAAEGQTIGVLTFSSREIRQPDERLLAAMRVIGGQIGQFLRRKETDEKVRRLSRVHAVLSGINALIVRVRDRDELFREACRIAVEVGNFSAAWMGTLDRASMEIRPSASHGMPDTYMEAIRDSLSKARAGGGGIAGQAIREKRAVISNDIANDPRVIIAKKTLALGTQSLAVLPFLSGDEPVGVLTLHARETGFFDAEEMKLLQDLAGNIAFAIDNLDKADRLQVEAAQRTRAETKVVRLNRVHAVLSGINAAIVRVQSREELFVEACRVAVENGQFRMAWIGIVDRAANRVKPLAWQGVGDEYIAKMPMAIEDTGPQGRGLAGRTIRERMPIVVDDMTEDPRITLKEDARQRGFHSLVMLPLMVEGEAVGLLALYASEIGFFDDEEMKLLGELAGDIAFALDHIDKKERLDYLAYYDQLTGLANRTLFHERLGRHLDAAQAAGGKVAVVVADIERFRMINDSLGRQAGDSLLKQVAERLAREVDRNDIARLGSDQFAIALPEMKGRSEIGRTVEELWRSCLNEPFMLGGIEIRVAMKGGIALFPSDGTDADALFRTAEAAWKKAKQTGERYLFHAPEMTARIAEKLTMENKLRQALEKEEFVLHYQPKVDLVARSIVGVEALIRWQSPERGLVPPGLFIPLLEETGLILQAGEWALKRAIQDHGRWLREGVAAPRIAVNVSAIQLRQRDFVEVVKRAIAGGVDPTAIDVEITESLLMENVADNIEKLKALRELGMKLSIDDFGTGYSSLGYLAKLPVHTLKIDRSFIITMLNDPDTMTLVSTIISLAHSLRLTVVAEGVEQEDQAKMLRLLRCDQMQGYLFSKPLPFEQLTPLLRAKS